MMTTGAAAAENYADAQKQCLGSFRPITYFSYVLMISLDR